MGSQVVPLLQNLLQYITNLRVLRIISHHIHCINELVLVWNLNVSSIYYKIISLLIQGSYLEPVIV